MHNNKPIRSKGRRQRMPALQTKRVMIEFPEDLLRRTDQIAEQLVSSRSAVVRSAVEEYLKAVYRRQLDELLAEGYRANAALSQQISEEFSHVDAENL